MPWKKALASRIYWGLLAKYKNHMPLGHEPEQKWELHQPQCSINKTYISNKNRAGSKNVADMICWLKLRLKVFVRDHHQILDTVISWHRVLHRSSFTKPCPILHPTRHVLHFSLNRFWIQRDLFLFLNHFLFFASSFYSTYSPPPHINKFTHRCTRKLNYFFHLLHVLFAGYPLGIRRYPTWCRTVFKAALQ